MHFTRFIHPSEHIKRKKDKCIDILLNCFYDDKLKQGYGKMKSNRFRIWRTRYLVLHRATSQSPSKLEKFPNEHCFSRKVHSKSFLLENVEDIKHHETDAGCGLSIIFKDGSRILLAFALEEECESWMQVLNRECLGIKHAHGNAEHVRDRNPSEFASDQFHVFLMPNSQCGIQGECLLQVTAENVFVCDIEEPRLKLLTWPLISLKKYGHDHSKFTIETGRHCTTGAGIFTFITRESDHIYHNVHEALLNVAEDQYRKAICLRNTCSLFPNRTSVHFRTTQDFLPLQCS